METAAQLHALNSLNSLPAMMPQAPHLLEETAPQSDRLWQILLTPWGIVYKAFYYCS